MSNRAKLKENARVIHGDWQTPDGLASEITHLVHQWIEPDLVIEPNCGRGAFLKAAQREFSPKCLFWGGDINRDYVDFVTAELKIPAFHEDFFAGAWKTQIEQCAGKILVLGNPPWVTNSELMRRDGANLPPKSNFEKFQGIEAITGKSNFDISLWMIQEEIQALQGKEAVLAMLCKTSVARKILEFAWKKKLLFTKAHIHQINAAEHFGVSVDAALFMVCFQPKTDQKGTACLVFDSLSPDAKPTENLGIRHQILVRNTETVDRFSDLLFPESTPLTWRSGVKHDCAKILELTRLENYQFQNGLNEVFELEPDLVFPLLKSSDVANGRVKKISRFLLMPQSRIGQDTHYIVKEFPLTWKYLNDHSDWFSRRKSSIYREKEPFSVFGVGDYSFSPWKLAISGLYKRLNFQVIGPFEGKPVLFDDTCYFLECSDPKNSREQAFLLGDLFQSDVCRDVLDALIFWDAKRPITRDVLNRISIQKLAAFLKRQEELTALFPCFKNENLFIHFPEIETPITNTTSETF